MEFGKKRPVIGFDINERRIAALKAGHDHTLEVEDDELAQAAQLSYTAERADLAQANVFIVTVPTPIDEYKQPTSRRWSRPARRLARCSSAATS